MKKIISLSMLLLCLTAFTAVTNAVPLTGTLNIPGDYGTLALAITDLNTQGVGVGGVTLNVIAGNPQSAPAGGYVIGGTGSAVLTTSSALNPILIMGNDNTVTASGALTAGALNDGIFKLIGADYVTIKRFAMTENPANSTTTAASNNMTEWGVALLYVTTTDGAQNNTVDSCTITLKRIYQNTFGIYSNSTHSATSVTTSATATTSNGGNSNLKVYNNQISDVNIGIVVVGPTAAADHNQGLDIGGTTVSKPNRITNYGTTGTFSSYANVSGTVNGVLVRNTVNFNVSNNTIRSSVGGTTAGTLRSIFVPAFTNAPVGANVNTISKNTISVQHGLASGALQGIIVDATTGNATSTIIIRENEIDTMNYVAVSPSGTVTAISQGTATLNQTISRNNYKNLIVNTTGSFTFVSNAITLPVGGTMNIDSNKIITGFTKTGAGGTVTFFNSNASSVNGSFVNMIGNDLTNITLNGATGFVGINNTDGASSSSGPLKNINDNKISNISNATGTINPATINFSGPGSNVNNNTISNITWGASVTCLTLGGSNQSTLTVSGNLIDPVTTTTGTVIGISTSSNGIKIFKNKIYDLTSNNSTGSVNGMLISGGTLVDVYNNLIGNLYTPITNSTSDNLRGINITSATTSSNINLSYNTIYLSASSTGANFSSTGVYHTTSTTATTGQLNMRNNIIVNLSLPSGTGLTVAYRRSSSTTTNYGSTSNNNLFYAGLPSASNLIYYDLTNSFSALSAYKTFITPRDAQSVTENPNFKSTVGSSPDFLHINELIPTQIESGATTVAGITDDYDSQPRYPNSGYPNNISFPATNPDIGADEFGGIPVDIVGPVITYTPLLDTCGYGSRNFYGVVITDASGVASGANAPRVYWSVNAGPWSSAATVSGTSPYDFIIGTAGLVDGDEISYFVIAQDSNGIISANPGTGLVATDVNNISTYPSNPNKYKAICTNDVGVIASSLNPIKTYSLGKGYDFTATVKNFGSATQTVIPVYYTVNAGPAIGPVFTTGPIPQNGTEVVTFSGGFAFVPLATGAYTIQIYTVLAGDITPANDAFNVNLFVSTKINTFPYVQNFTAPTDWNVVIESNVGTSPIWGLAPCVNPDGVAADNAVIADFYSASSGRVEILRSPEMDLSLLTNPTLDFYVAYKSYSNNANDTMQVLVSTDGGVTFFSAATTWKKYKDLVPSLATLPNSSTEYAPAGELEWRHETIDLSNVAGNSNVVIGFRGLSKFGNNGWIDNVIVSNVSSLCTDNVTTTGTTYSCNPYLSLLFTAMPAPPPVVNPDNGTAVTKQNANTINMTPFHTEDVRVRVIDNANSDNPTGGVAFVSRTNNNDPGQVVETNLTATPPSGPPYTPSYVYHDYWFTTTYTGNDYTGYATYDIEIDLDGLVFADPTKLYIVKRTDRTGKWICQNTTLSLNKLKVTGLTDFCDFALAGDEALPVELASFTSVIDRRDVTLNWTTVTETNNSGFDIERKSADGQWSKVGNVAGHGTTLTPVNYTFTERNLATGKYSYRLKQIDFNGNFEYFSLNNEVNIGIPEKYDLSQNYPNPFNPSTKISFDIPVDGKVSMKIFDMSGKEVATLVNDFRTAGYYTVDFNASALSSGIYFYKISTGNFTATKKMMLVK